MDEREQLYVATIERLEQQIGALEKNRKSLKWYFLAALALAGPAALIHWAAALAVIILGGCVYFVGGYISLVHIAEDRSAIADARTVLESLREPSPPASSTSDSST